MAIGLRVVGLEDMRSAESARSPEVFSVPEHWVDPRLEGMDRLLRYVPSERVSVPARSVFGNRPMDIVYEPTIATNMRFGVRGEWVEVDPSAAANGLRNIVLQTRSHALGICEHTLALRHLGLEADVSLHGADNFPNHPGGVQTELTAVLPSLIRQGLAPRTTVAEPIGFQFGPGRYFHLYPDDGSGQLILDHEFDHPGNVLGRQRVEYTVEPTTLAYISAARTICYKWFLKAGLRACEALGLSHPPGLNLSRQNVLVAGRRHLWNWQEMFTVNGRNVEALMHEVIDKLGALGLCPGRFAGRVVTRCTNHAADIAAVQHLQQQGHLTPTHS